MIILVLIIVITALFFIWRREQNKRFNELAAKLPGPPVIPIFGNTLSIRKHRQGTLDYLMKACKDYGTVTRHLFGSHLFVMLSDPDDVEIILKDNKNIRKSHVYDFLKPWLGEGLVTSTGEHWHHHRKSLTAAFHFKILERFVEVFDEKGKILVSKLSKHAGGEAFNIVPYITLYTLDAIMETSMGQTINAQNETKSDYVVALARLQEVIMQRIFNPMLGPDFIFNLTKLGREHNELLIYINDYCKKVIQQRRKTVDEIDIEKLNDTDDLGKKIKRLAFLDLLLVGQKMGNNLSDEDLLDEVNTFLFAGHDTTSTAITFAIYNLAKHQEIQERVYEEIAELFGDDEEGLTMQDLQKTKYLDMFVKESLRIFPPVASVSRLLETDLKLTKYTIPAGASVAVFKYMLHRNEEHFPNPEEFDPERFSPENTKGKHSYSFLPFSAGPRNCIGQKYALAEIKSTIIDILKNYKILYAEDIEKIENYLVLTPIGGVKVRLVRRSNNV